MLFRPAIPKDALAVARLHVRSWRSAYRGLLPDEYLDALRAEDRAGRYDFNADPSKPSTVLAMESDSVLGFATTAAACDPDAGGAGELAALHVDPDRHGEGIGRALMAIARGRLANQGFRRAILWVLAGNVRAEHFYRADGWDADGSRRTQTVWDLEVEEVRYQRALTEPTGTWRAA